MTDGSFEPAETEDREGRLTTSSVFDRAVARVRVNPSLLLPFVLAGIVLTVLDRLRLRDPVPTVERAPIGIDEITVQFGYVGYPTGVPGTSRRLDAVVDLEVPYLLWAVGLEVVALVAVAAAGWYTIARAADAEPTAKGFGSYLGLIVLFTVALWALGSIGDVAPLGPFGLVVALGLLVVVLLVFIRLFLAPALAALGEPLRSAIGRSYRLTGGHELALAGLVVTYGLLAWLIGAVPYVGAFTSTVTVAVIHAVSTVIALESITADEPSPDAHS